MLEKIPNINKESDKKRGGSPKEISRRTFLKGMGAGTVLGVLGQNPLEATAGEKDPEHLLEQNISRFIEYFNMAEDLVLRGKRIKIEPLRNLVDKIIKSKATKYQKGDLFNNREIFYEAIADIFGHDQAVQLIDSSWSQQEIMKAIFEGKTGLEIMVNKLDDLREGMTIDYDKIIMLSQYYSLGSMGKKEYGILFEKNDDNTITIQQAVQGGEGSVNLEHAGPIISNKDNVTSLHTHPNKFSFFSLSDFMVYLNSMPSIEYKNKLNAKVVDRSGIVWNMNFDKMPKKVFEDLKKEITLTLKLPLVTKAINLTYGEEMVDDWRRLLLNDNLRNNIIKDLETLQILEPDKYKPIIQILNDLPIEFKNLRNIIQLTHLNKLELGQKNHNNKMPDLQRGFIEYRIKVQKGFQKYGVNVFPEIPGRLLKNKAEWKY